MEDIGGMARVRRTDEVIDGGGGQWVEVPTEITPEIWGTIMTRGMPRGRGMGM